MKVLKDPVYGYIKLEKDILDKIVDTPEFQRLRHIEQTSYTPLYSSALHNRFVHSIGVYHLGRIASDTLLEYINNDEELKLLNDKQQIQELCEDFNLACLLHDVGHSPFSHSGEKFYYSSNGSQKEPIFLSLKTVINSSQFSQDFELCIENKTLPKQHEIMSAIIGADKFKNLIKDSEFFARCITGILYKEDKEPLTQVKNVFIQLLNSSCIDVDKIDYLLRDAYVTGFETISIDYIRLLSNVEIKPNKEKLEFVFNKRALSVLENVIYAHDSERKWIQNHPIVLYESFLVQFAIQSVVNFYKKNGINLFSQDALSAIGIQKEMKVRLLCDDDIIYTMKNQIDSDLINEYFDRSIRRHPMWKSEAEFKVIFDNNKGRSWIKAFSVILEKLNNFLEKDCSEPLLNKNALDCCNRKLSDVKNREGISDYDKKQFTKKYENLLKIIEAFEKLANAMKVPFDFVIIKANRFQTGFSKNSLQEMLIDFEGFEYPRALKLVTQILDSLPDEEKNFYYLYYKRDNSTSTKLSRFSTEIENLFAPIINAM